MQSATFELCKNKRRQSRLKDCNFFFCTNNEKCKFVLSTSTLFFRKWPIGKSTLDFHVGQIENMIENRLEIVMKKIAEDILKSIWTNFKINLGL